MSTYVKSRREYLQSVRENDPSIVIVDHQLLEGEQQNESSLADEQAKLLVGVFGKLTSVVFDISTICELLAKEDLD